MLVYLFILLRRLPWRPFSSWLWFLPGPSRRSGTRKTWERIITTFLLFRWKNPGNIKWEMPRSTLSLSLSSAMYWEGGPLYPLREDGVPGLSPSGRRIFRGRRGIFGSIPPVMAGPGGRPASRFDTKEEVGPGWAARPSGWGGPGPIGGGIMPPRLIN